MLVVDDNQTNRRILDGFLARMEMTAVCVDSAAEALSALDTSAETDTPFDMAILDVLMPGKDGFQVLQEVGNHPDLDSMRVILLTASGHDMDRAHATALGVDEFLTKPFSPTQVLARTRELLAPGALP